MRQAGNTWSLAVVLVNLGAAALQQGDHQQARDHVVEGLRLWRELGNQTGSMMAVAGLAEVAAAQGQAERAGRRFGAADALFPVGGLLLDGSDRAAFDRRIAEARTRLDEAAFAAGWAAGQAMTLDQAIAVALEETR